LATELVGLKPDVIAANGTQAARAAQQATKSIPIVMVASNPIGDGFPPSSRHANRHLMIAYPRATAGYSRRLLPNAAPQGRQARRAMRRKSVSPRHSMDQPIDQR
jgi:hypothetical protein